MTVVFYTYYRYEHEGWKNPVSNHHHRIVYNGEDCLVEDLTQFGWAKFSTAVPHELEEHVHPDCFEFCYIVSGAVSWWVGHEVYDLEPGTLFMTFPDEAHGGLDGTMHPCELFWFQLTFKRGGYSDSLRTAVHGLPLRSCPVPVRVRNLFQQIFVELQNQDQWSAPMVETLLHEMLYQVIRSATSYQKSGMHKERGFSSRITTAIKRIGECPPDTLDLDQIAKSVGLRPTQFRLLFKSETGFSPKEYIQRVRNRSVQQALRNQEVSITEIAYKHGFSSSQHLASNFKKLNGMTPREFRTRHIVKGSDGE